VPTCSCHLRLMPERRRAAPLTRLHVKACMQAIDPDQENPLTRYHHVAGATMRCTWTSIHPSTRPARAPSRIGNKLLVLSQPHHYSETN
jgi:hypothetical protein